MKKQILALFVSTIMLLSTFSSFAYADNTTYKTGDTIEYGNYPSYEITNSDTITALNSLANSIKWNSYNYYSGTGAFNGGDMSPSNFMRYKDVTYLGDNYRAVIFDTYRPGRTGELSSTTTSDRYQEKNGYYYSKVYWFKYTPIRWKIENGYLICCSLIDSQPFNNYWIWHSGYSYGSPSCSSSHIANNYGRSY